MSKSKKKMRVKWLKILKINSITLPKTTVFSREELKWEVLLNTLREKENMETKKKKMLERVNY